MGNRQGERTPPRRVLLLSENAGLAALMKGLLGRTGRLSRFGTLREVLEQGILEDVDTVVLELHRGNPHTLIAQVRHHWRGPLVVLAERGQLSGDLAPDPGRTLLNRPFSTYALGTAIGLSGYRLDHDVRPMLQPLTSVPGQQPAAPALATATADTKAAARRASSWSQFATGVGRDKTVGRVARTLATLTHGWQTSRRVQVAGFSVVALVAFTVAFALAAQGGCGSSCHELRTGIVPAPTVAPTVATVESGGPPTPVRAREPGATTDRQRTPSNGAFSGGVIPSTTTARGATTARRPGSAAGGTDPTTPTTERTTPTTATTEPPTPTTPTTPTTEPTTPTTPTTEPTTPTTQPT